MLAGERYKITWYKIALFPLAPIPRSHNCGSESSYSKAFLNTDEIVFAIISMVAATIRLAEESFLLHLRPCGYFYSLTGGLATS